MNKLKTLFIITTYYPYSSGGENSFLRPELPFLQEQFERVIVVPCRIRDRLYSIPEGVDLNNSYALPSQSIKSNIIVAISALSFPLLGKELIKRKRYLLKPNVHTRLIQIAGDNQRMHRWLRSLIRKEKLDLTHTLFYTYWLGLTTLGIGMLKREFPNIKVVSRAHGYDVYDYRYSPAYIPFQEECLRVVDKVFFISKDGCKYINSQYPWMENKSELFRLGVAPSSNLTKRSQDNVFRIASCSAVISVKRVELLLQGLINLARNQPTRQFEWHHFGDGPLLQDLRSQAHNAPTNLSVFLEGYLPNELVLKKYREIPFNLFVNVSSSEGISVAIMEAMSCGIPVVATSVGGTSEIVSHANGALLPNNTTEAEISNVVWSVLSNPLELESKRKASFATWEKQYNANVNYHDFALRLSSIID